MNWALLCLVLAAEDPAASTKTPTADELRFFETSIRPVLVENCHGCHGEKKQWANLRLDSRKGILQGGDSGPAIEPGKPSESLLIQAIRHEDESLKMPKDKKLSERQIADLTRWVEMGVPYPETQTAEKRTRDPNHWSFQPPKTPEVPAVKDTAWAQSEIDRFVLAKLEAAGLKPASKADRETLIRRVTFDLTGLPPTPAEIEVWLKDESPDAWSRLVDRLLDSPAYGERWGRHWLDVARYADSNGLDENVCHGNAWRYRDYVVAAFNKDKPYNQFIREQLAGDLLPHKDEAELHEHLIATGFLALGAKVLAEVDETQMQMDIVDEQIDTTGKAFLGLTLGCARCHNHKFDPIEAADYYGLAGIFKSSRAMDSYTKLARWYEHPLPSDAAKAMQAAYDARVASAKEAVDKFVAEADQKVKASMATDAKPPEKLEPLYPEPTKAELKKLRAALAAIQKDPPELPSAMGIKEDKVADVAIHVRGSHLKLGDIAPRHVPPVLKGPKTPEFTATESGRRQLADWLSDPEHPLTSRVLVNRVWRWHFGRGIVASTDNFGLLGDAPSHPELLDWLARRFVADGWSIKSLHRLILNSAAWQQSCVPSPEAMAADPENRLLSRMSVRRLEAEEVRDNLLAVGGRLDLTLGGSLLKVKNRGYFFDHTSIDLTDYTSNRRSLYLPIVRNNVFDMFQLMDFPDPAVSSSSRTTTTVALQALMAMNSDFVMQCAEDLAGRVLAEPGDDSQRMTRLYAIAYGRTPTESERQSNVAFLAQTEQALAAQEPDAAKRRRTAWNVLSHVLMSANEFIYVR